jgi:hypothetical protein
MNFQGLFDFVIIRALTGAPVIFAGSIPVYFMTAFNSLVYVASNYQMSRK